LPQALEVRPPQGFGEDVGCVVGRPNAGDFEGLLLDELPDRMELYLDVFDGRVAGLIFSEAGSRVVVAVQRGRSVRQETKAIQELTQEGGFVGRLVQCNVFRIA